MATRDGNSAILDPFSPEEARKWSIFACRSFAHIVARKHNIIVPSLDTLEILSDEELERRMRLLSELAHLPPG